MNVLVVAEGLDLPETHLLKGLADAGCNVRVLLGGPCPESAVRACGLTIERLALRGRVDRHARRRLREIVDAEGIRLVHCLRNNRPLANVLPVLRRRDVRLVAYRGTSGHLSRFNPGAWLTYLNPRIDRITCVSEAVRRYLLGQGVSPERAVTIHKGHDPSWYTAYAPLDLQAELGVPAGSLVVGTVANVRPVKGVDVLLRSFAHLPQDGSVHMVVVGSLDDPRIKREAEAQPYGRFVHFTGFRDDASRLAGAFDVFVMPSVRREGLPRAVIEAMSQAVCPVVSNVGGMPELVRDGQDGLVVPARDAAALGRSLRTLLQQPERRLELGRHAAGRIAGDFSVVATVERTLALYRELVP